VAYSESYIDFDLGNGMWVRSECTLRIPDSLPVDKRAAVIKGLIYQAANTLWPPSKPKEIK